MSKRYFFDDPTLAELANFPRYRGALCAIGIDDDPWATPPAIDLLLTGFTGTRPNANSSTRARSEPAPIGHFGFFRPLIATRSGARPPIGWGWVAGFVESTPVCQVLRDASATRSLSG